MARPRSLIIVKSVHHGNTARIARAMADVLGADVLAPEEVPFTSVDDYSVMGFGSGVYYGRMHAALTGWVGGLPDSRLSAKPAFVFSTSGLPVLAGIWHAPLKRALARKGFVCLGEFRCRGYDTWGPLRFAGGLNRKRPDEHDLARAAQFAAEVARRVASVEAASGAA